MRRIAFAIAVATLSVAAVSGTSQAAPIAPLSGVTTTAIGTDNGNITQVYWRRGWHGGWRGGWHRGPRCWRGRYGRLHCW